MSIYHLISYAEWTAGGRTHCCHQPVTDLPRTDYCGRTWADREPSQIRCGPPAVPR